MLGRAENEYSRQAESAVFDACCRTLVESYLFEKYAKVPPLSDEEYNSEMVRAGRRGQRKSRLKELSQILNKKSAEWSSVHLGYLRVYTTLRNALQTLGKIETESVWEERLARWELGIVKLQGALYSDANIMTEHPFADYLNPEKEHLLDGRLLRTTLSMSLDLYSRVPYRLLGLSTSLEFHSLLAAGLSLEFFEPYPNCGKSDRSKLSYDLDKILGPDELSVASEQGHIVLMMLMFLLGIKLPSNFRDRNGRTLLHCATSFGYIDVVRALLVFESRPVTETEYSPLLNEVDTYGNTALDLAFLANDGAMLRLLLFYGATSYVPDRTDSISRMLRLALELAGDLSSNLSSTLKVHSENPAHSIARLERESLEEFGRARFHWAVWLGSDNVIKDILGKLRGNSLLALRTVTEKDSGGSMALQFVLQGGGRRILILDYLSEKFPDILRDQKLAYELATKAFEYEKAAAAANTAFRISSESKLNSEYQIATQHQNEGETVGAFILRIQERIKDYESHQEWLQVDTTSGILRTDAPITRHLLRITNLKQLTFATFANELEAAYLSFGSHIAVELVKGGDLLGLMLLIAIMKRMSAAVGVELDCRACLYTTSRPDASSPLALAIANSHSDVVIALLSHKEAYNLNRRLIEGYLFEGPDFLREPEASQAEFWRTGNPESSTATCLFHPKSSATCRLEDCHKNLLSVAAEFGQLEMVSFLLRLAQKTSEQLCICCKLIVAPEDSVEAKNSNDDTKTNSVPRNSRPQHWQIPARSTSSKLSFPSEAPSRSNQQLGEFMRPLAYASALGQLKIVEILLSQQKCDIISKLDGKGRSALSYASQNGHSAVVRILLGAGADVNGDFWDEEGCRRRYGEYDYNHWGDNSRESAVPRSPLSYTAEEGHLDVMRELLGHGTSVNLPDLYGYTPLYHACIHGRGPAAYLLLENGAQINILDNSGSTILLRVSQAAVNTQGHFLQQPHSAGEPNAPVVEYQQFVKEEDPINISDPSGKTWKLWDNYPRDQMVAFLRAFGATESVPKPSAEETGHTVGGQTSASSSV